MFKYFIWVLKVIFPAIYHYPWIFRYSRHPEKYPLELRYKRVRALVLQFLKILKVDPIAVNMPKLEANQKVYLVGNHVSFFDPIVMIALSDQPITFVSKIETRKFIFVGRIVRIIDGVFIERGNLKQEIKMMQEIKQSLMTKNISWAIFPEGTRNKIYDAPMGDFKAGSFKLPLSTNVPILPVAIWGSQTVLPTKIHWKRYPIYVHYLPLIHPQEFSGNTQELAASTKNLIQEEVNKLRAQYPQLVAKYSKNKEFIKYLK